MIIKHRKLELSDTSPTLTVWEGKNADDQEKRDDQDETHPQVIVRVSIISAMETCGHTLKYTPHKQTIFLFLFHQFHILSHTSKKQ